MTTHQLSFDNKAFYDLAKDNNIGLVIKEITETMITLTSTKNPLQFVKACNQQLKTRIYSSKDKDLYNINIFI